MATRTMEQMEVGDYMNEQPRCEQKCSRDKNQTERRLPQLLFFSFGVVCIIQAALNISLRLALYSSEGSSPLNCNTTHLSDQDKDVETYREGKLPGHCNTLQERFNALTRDKNLLENRNSELNNMIKDVEEERDRLRIMLRDLGGTTPALKCPAGWREISSRCYFLSSESRTWQESRKHCQNNGADLVVISSEQEQAALYRLDGDRYLLFWIGLYKTNEIFKWVDGSALTEQFWQAGQPDHGGPNNREECVEMYHENPERANWNDAPCQQKRRWLCEKKQTTDSIPVHNRT